MADTDIRLETEDLGSVLVIKVLNSRIKYEQSAEFGEQLQQAINIYDGGNVLLDLEEVDYLTSDTLGRLISLRKSLGDGGEMKIVLTNKTVREVFKITNLDTIIEVHSSKAKALKAFDA